MPNRLDLVEPAASLAAVQFDEVSALDDAALRQVVGGGPNGSWSTDLGPNGSWTDS